PAGARGSTSTPARTTWPLGTCTSRSASSTAKARTAPSRTPTSSTSDFLRAAPPQRWSGAKKAVVGVVAELALGDLAAGGSGEVVEDDEVLGPPLLRHAPSSEVGGDVLERE